MLKASVVSARVHVLRTGELAKPMKTLERERVDEVLFGFTDVDIPVDWILDFPPTPSHGKTLHSLSYPSLYKGASGDTSPITV
jgi:hypothetical protein